MSVANFNLKEYPQLASAIENDSLIIFVGAGLSISLKNKDNQPIGNWTDLVRQILGEIQNEVLQPLIDKYPPIKVLGLIQDDPTTAPIDIFNFLKTHLDLSDENNFGLHQKIYQLSPKLITTNYDTAFEQASPELYKYVAHKGKPHELEGIKEENPVLFKLHGCQNNSDSMILFPQQYEDLYNSSSAESEHTLHALRNLIYNKTILFVGSGMGDFQINNIFKGIKKLQGKFSKQHFIISKEPLDSRLSFLRQIPINDYNEIETLVNKLLEFKKGVNKKKSPEVIRLEKELSNVKKELYELKKVMPEEEETRTIKYLLEREALEHFEKGLEFQLKDNWEKAEKEYQRSLELDSNNAEAFFNWGTVLIYHARRIRSKEMLKSTFDKFAQAIEIDKEHVPAFNNWSSALCEYATMEVDLDLLALALEKAKAAVNLEPENAVAYTNWGNVLLSYAETKGETGLYFQANEKYAKAAELDPTAHAVFNNWGNSLSQLAKLTNDQSLLLTAIDKANIAIDNGGNSYNLACFYSLKGNLTGALPYLKSSLSNKEIHKEFVLNDKDWKQYHTHPDFLALMEKY